MNWISVIVALAGLVCTTDAWATTNTTTNTTADCPELYENRCFPEYYPNGTEFQWCPGPTDPTTCCKTSSDYCMPTTIDNSYYAKSLGAAEVCPNFCYPNCDYSSQISCQYKLSNGCSINQCVNRPGNETANSTSSSMYSRSGEECPFVCEAICSEHDLMCSGYYDNGCSSGSYCTPKATRNWNGGGECPGFCPTQCNYTAGEQYCYRQSDDGCTLPNTCEMPDADGNVCMDANGSTAVRMDRYDEMVLRSNDPKSIQVLYAKLMKMKKK